MIINVRECCKNANIIISVCITDFGRNEESTWQFLLKHWRAFSVLITELVLSYMRVFFLFFPLSMGFLCRLLIQQVQRAWGVYS